MLAYESRKSRCPHMQAIERASCGRSILIKTATFNGLNKIYTNKGFSSNRTKKKGKKMKNVKKFMSLMIAVVMMMAMTVTTFAATIEVDGAFEDETYNAYKILEYTSDTTVEPAAYSYYLLDADYNSALGTALKAAGFKFTQSADKTQWYVNNADELKNSGAAIAKTLYESLDTWKDAALSSATATGSDAGKASFTDLETGYWFVTSSLGSLCTLQSYDDEEMVVEKNTMITDEKTVDTENESLQVGDTATYTIKLTDGKGTNLPATLTDTMSAGLTYNNDAVVTVPDKSEGAAEGATKTLVKDTDYTVSVTGGNGSATVIVYTFPADLMTALDEGDQIVVTYTATLNQYASLDGSEKNTEVTTYSEQDTPGNTVTVKDYNLTIQKKANSEAGDSLKGAQFALYRGDATTALSIVAITVENPADNTVYYRVAAEGETGATTVIDMTDAYDAVIYGLDGDDTYSIEETKAPDGYNKLEGKIPVAMSDTNKVQPVVNNAGSVLPSTGGIGTTLFYVIGAILVLGSGVLMVSKKRMGAN